MPRAVHRKQRDSARSCVKEKALASRCLGQQTPKRGVDRQVSRAAPCRARRHGGRGELLRPRMLAETRQPSLAELTASKPQS
eukprot:9372867-Pyramimonas_sp.AAC.2